jgi:hypothetical protein
VRARARSRIAEALLTGLSLDPTSPRLADTFNEQVLDVVHNRCAHCTSPRRSHSTPKHTAHAATSDSAARVAC